MVTARRNKVETVAAYIDNLFSGDDDYPTYADVEQINQQGFRVQWPEPLGGFVNDVVQLSDDDLRRAWDMAHAWLPEA